MKRRHPLATSTNPIAWLLLLSLTLILQACGGGGGPAATYKVGGTVAGLGDTPLVLQNNGSETLSLSANGSYQFSASLNANSPYNITIHTQPDNQYCEISQGSGTVTAQNITGINITCQAAYTIGGTVTGLSGGQLQLQNNGGDTLTIDGNGGFTFSTPIVKDLAYAVMIATQASDPIQSCRVINGQGVMGEQNIFNLHVECVNPQLQISVGARHSCAIRSGGQAYCWGAGLEGPFTSTIIGDEPEEVGDLLTALPLGTGLSVAEIAMGGGHNCARFTDGRVKCWGSNSLGQAGTVSYNIIGDELNEIGDALPYVDLGSGRTARSISISSRHSCALLNNGSIKCWGFNNSGQLGQGHTNNLGDDANEMGNNLPAIDLGSGRTAQSIAVGEFHSCALLDNGNVKCWGYNSSGRLGQAHANNVGDDANEMGDNLPAVNLGTGRTAKVIAVGRSHSCALLDNDSVKCWGANGRGQLGQGYISFSISYNGYGPNDLGDNLPAVDLGAGRTAQAIAAGEDNTCALLDGGSIKCWGYNSYGQLGQGHKRTLGDHANEMGDNLPAINLGTGRTAQAVTSGDHSCALLDDNSIKCWGFNQFAQLGLGHKTSLGDDINEMGDNLPAIDLGSGHAAHAVVVGYLTTCAILDTAQVKCWGSNGASQSALGGRSQKGDEKGEMIALFPIALGSGRSVQTIVTPGLYYDVNYTCALLDNGSVKCWGNNKYGQLGQGHTSYLGDDTNDMGDNLHAVNFGSGRTVKAISAYYAHSCALLDNESIKCWGYNWAGQLGQGHTDNVGDGVNEMGDNLPYVDLGTGRTVQSIAVGEGHSCALLDGGSIKCWGGNGSGQLGQGHRNALGDGANEMGDNLPEIDLGTGRTAQAIAAGVYHTCALLDGGSIKCWGDNTWGQLGQGERNSIGVDANQMGDHLATIDIGSGRSALAITASGRSSCALLDDGSVKCWGRSNSGQLGQGHTNDIGDQINQMGDYLPITDLGNGRAAVAITASEESTCALLDDGSFKCWGANSYGQLGLGHAKNIGDNANEMGDNLPSINFSP